MNNKIKILILIVIIIIAGISCGLLLKNHNTVKIMTENEVDNEIIANIFGEVENVFEEVEGSVENKLEEITTIVNEPEISSSVVNTIHQETIYDKDENIGTTDKKQEAINLVKADWGEDDTVTFRCDSITNDGIYIIAVVSKKTATVKNYFRVDLEKKTVVIDY